MTDEPTLPAGPSFGLTFLYYFCGTALVTTLLAVKTLGIGLDTVYPTSTASVWGRRRSPRGLDQPQRHARTAHQQPQNL
jgi:hypothetical protein